MARLMDVRLAWRKAPRSRAWLANTPTIENEDLLCFMLSHNKATDRAPMEAVIVGGERAAERLLCTCEPIR